MRDLEKPSAEQLWKAIEANAKAALYSKAPVVQPRVLGVDGQSDAGQPAGEPFQFYYFEFWTTYSSLLCHSCLFLYFGKNAALISMLTEFLFKSLEALIVVPLPTNGSRTVSPT